MKESKKLIRTYFKSPREYKIIMLAAVLLVISSILVLANGFTNYVPKNRQAEYVCYNGVDLNAGDKAYLDVTGIDEGIKERDGRTFHAVIDEGIEADDWYYYMVLIDDNTYRKMARQAEYYYEDNLDPVPYRLWGSIVTPSDAFVEEVMEFYNFDAETYYRTFGSTYLVVDTYNETLRSLAAYAMMLGFGAFMFCLSLMMTHAAKVSQIMKFIADNYDIDEVAEELGNSPLTYSDPTFTENYLFNRKTVTVIRTSDIAMVSPIDQGLEHFLAAFLVQGKYISIARRNKDGYDEIIDKIREKNPDLLINNTPDNFDRYQKIVRQHQEDNK